MLFKKIMIIFGTLIFITGLLQSPASAQIENVTMQVKGMTCPFCVYGIEKKLKAVDSIKDADANLKNGTVDIKLENNKSLDLRKLNETVEKSGFTPGKTKIKVSGSLTTYNLEGKESPALKVTGSDQILLLVSKPEHGEEEALSDKKSQEIKKATENGKEDIVITGYIHSHSEGVPSALSVNNFEAR